MSVSGQVGESATKEGVVRVEITAPLAVVYLGSPQERVVTFTGLRMASLDEALEQIENADGLLGVVFIGSMPGVFCQGADVNAINEITDYLQAEAAAREGQRIFQRIADLKQTTVAAISGSCVGGGYELALACDYRVSLDYPSFKIGLPEIKLGILPGFGGSQRLPRLIGLPSALDLILKGLLLPPPVAKKKGLVDLLVAGGEANPDVHSFKQLLSIAVAIATGEKKISKPVLTLRDRLLTHTGIGRGMVKKQALAGVRKATRGFYPAPPRALDVCVNGLAGSLQKGLEEEARALGELLVTPESKSLVYLYFLTEQSTKRWKRLDSELSGAFVGVIGAGTMGAGIAAALVIASVPVVLIDLSEEARNRAKQHVHKALSRRFRGDEQKVARAMEYLTIDSSLDALSKCTLVVEAIIEKLEVKKKVFMDLSALVSPQTIIASNTSSLPISEISSGVPGEERVIGMHFFNPAERMPLVEVVRSGSSDARSIAYTAGLAAKLGKYPVVVEEVPGFLVNRLLSPYLLEAAWGLNDGYSIQDIDLAALSFGMPMGPLRLLDEVGLDVAGHVADIIGSSYGDRLLGPSFSGKLASLGRLGKKSGQGFYRYDGKEEIPDDNIHSVLGVVPEPGFTKNPEQLVDRLILCMVNEAIRCLDEGVAGTPGLEAAQQVDLATVMGTGFAPFRGGIIRYADSIGASALNNRLQHLATEIGSRFAPANGIISRAQSGKSFYDVLG